VAKSLIFMPMAISMVGAAVIWRYVYYRNTRREDIGLLNAILTGTGSWTSRSTSTPAPA
jgi:alpha-glucoside transport system permease protein